MDSYERWASGANPKKKQRQLIFPQRRMICCVRHGWHVMPHFTTWSKGVRRFGITCMFGFTSKSRTIPTARKWSIIGIQSRSTIDDIHHPRGMCKSCGHLKQLIGWWPSGAQITEKVFYVCWSFSQILPPSCEECTFDFKFFHKRVYFYFLNAL